MIHGADGVALRRHHLHALGLDRLLELLRDREREQIVAGEHGDALDVLVLGGDELGDRHRDGFVAGQRREDVFEVLVEDFLRGCRRRQHRNLILLRDGARRLGRARAERREQELHLVLGDHPLGGLHRARRVRRVIGVDDLDLVGLAAGLDALGVRGLGPEIVAALLLQPFRRKRAGQRQRRADLDDVLREAGLRAWGEPRATTAEAIVQEMREADMVDSIKRVDRTRRAARAST